TLYYDTYSYYPVFPTVAVCGTWNRSDAVPNPSVSDTCWSELATVLSTWLPVFPVDPLNGTTSTEPPTPHVYIYQTVNDGAGYRLGAVLETSALAGDGCALGGGAPSDFPTSFYCVGQGWE
ncbi:MAG: hypothetical protein NUV54_00375, partial [Candidatus Taylorbacteria bacterium]|nr:hypothetical protein [Candidatus Taylorbacteria bacterium]